MRKKFYYVLLACLLIGSAVVNAQVTIGSKDDPHAGAVLELKSADKGLLLPRVKLDAADKWTAGGKAMGGSPVEGMMVFNEGTALEEGVYVWADGEWSTVHGTTTTSKKTGTGIGGGTGNSAPATVSIGYGRTLTFMSHNLGADTSLDPVVYKDGILGDLYQWGRVADGHEKRTSKIASPNGVATAADLDENGQIKKGNAKYGMWIAASIWCPQNDLLWGDGTQRAYVEKSVNDPCPDGWRIPTQQEWEAVFAYNEWKWTGNGWRATGTDLYLPAAGTRYGNGTVDTVGTYGYYWSSTVSSTTSAYYSYFHNNSKYPANYVNDRGFGFSVRCVQE